MGEPVRVVSGCRISNFLFFAGANVAVLTVTASSKFFGAEDLILNLVQYSQLVLNKPLNWTERSSWSGWTAIIRGRTGPARNGLRYHESVDAALVKRLAAECGFELAGVARAVPLPEASWYREWVSRGLAGEMSYLTDSRAEVRSDPRLLLPTARSIICVGKLYNTSRALLHGVRRSRAGAGSRVMPGDATTMS